MAYWRTYYHLVWTTKNREPLILPAIEKRLYAYLIHKAAELGVIVYGINGMADHVHLVVSIPPKHAVAEVVQRLKGASSYDLGMQGYEFEWQRGYGVLSMGEKQRPVAQAYVENQKTHHSSNTISAILEYCTEIEEGPSGGMPIDENVPAVIREAHPTYEHLGESPF